MIWIKKRKYSVNYSIPGLFTFAPSHIIVEAYCKIHAYYVAKNELKSKNGKVYWKGIHLYTPPCTTSMEVFSKTVFPLIRRTYPSLIANELVSVQPLNMPSGLIFYLDFDDLAVIDFMKGPDVDKKFKDVIYKYD